MSKYIVKEVVSDYGIFVVDDSGEENLVEICNSKSNAEVICEIFNADLMKDGVYTVWKDSVVMDLLSKLKEKEEQLKLAKANESFEKEKKNNALKLIDQLKQQLEESEEINKKLAEHSQSVDKALDDSCEIIRNLKKQLHTANQETLHFQNKYFAEKQIAIEELEKVKKTLSAYVRDDHIIWDFNVNEVIDQQIKSLKGEK